MLTLKLNLGFCRISSGSLLLYGISLAPVTGLLFIPGLVGAVLVCDLGFNGIVDIWFCVEHRKSASDAPSNRGVAGWKFTFQELPGKLQHGSDLGAGLPFGIAQHS
jgi:hypothetical protein